MGREEGRRAGCGCQSNPGKEPQDQVLGGGGFEGGRSGFPDIGLKLGAEERVPGREVGGPGALMTLPTHLAKAW